MLRDEIAARLRHITLDAQQGRVRDVMRGIKCTQTGAAGCLIASQIHRAAAGNVDGSLGHEHLLQKMQGAGIQRYRVEQEHLLDLVDIGELLKRRHGQAS